MSLLFFFNDTATTEIYTLSLHDALPIYDVAEDEQGDAAEHRSDDRAGDERLLVGVLEVRDAAEAGEDDGGDDAAADEQDRELEQEGQAEDARAAAEHRERRHQQRAEPEGTQRDDARLGR